MLRGNLWFLFAVPYCMKYTDLLWMLDVLYRFYPRYHTHDLILLAEDIWKWVNNELPEDSAALVYLKTLFTSPTEAIQWVWDEIELLTGAYRFHN